MNNENGFWCNNGDIFQTAEILGVAIDKWLNGDMDQEGVQEEYEGKKDLWIEDVRNMDAGVRDKKKTELATKLSEDDSFMSLKSNGQKEAYVQLLINKGKIIEMAKTEMKTVVDMALVLSQIDMDDE